MRNDLLLERFALLVLKAIHFFAVMETNCQSGETELEGHEHTVQLLEKGGDSTQLSAMFETDDTTAESCQRRKLLGLSTVELAVPGKGAKAKPLQHDKSDLDDLCRRSTPGFLLRRLLESGSSLR